MLVIAYLGKVHGGVNDLINLTRGLRSSGLLDSRTEIFTLYYIEDLENTIESTGAKYRWVIKKRKGLVSEAYANILATFALYKYIASGSCIVRMMPHPLDLYFNLTKSLFSKSGSTSLIVRHNPIGFRYVKSNLRNKIVSFIDDLNTKDANFVLFLSRNVQRSFDGLRDIADKSFYIGFGSNRFGEGVNEYASLKGNVNLLFFGRILPYKGLDDFLLAIPYVKSNIKVTIAGYGLTQNQRELISSLSEFCEIEVFDEWISDAVAHSLHLQTNIVVLPYRSISQSGPLLSAIGYNVPIIGPDIEGFREFVESNVNGFTFKPGDVKDLALKIDDLCNLSTYERIKLGCINKAPDYDWGAVANRLWEAINNVHA